MAVRPIIVAHRGLAGYAPENTLAAYGAALDLRFGLEVDLALTADDEIVMLHDRRVDRTTDGSGPSAELSLAAIRRLDAGAWFDPVYAGQRVPTLRETLALARDRAHEQMLIALDFKPTEAPLEERVVEMVASYDLVEQVMAIGATIHSPEARRRIKQTEPHLPTAQLIESAEAWYAALDDADVDWLYIRYVPTPDQAADAHRAGKRIFKAGPLANGIEPEAWRALRDVGVDAILSDFPLECRQVLRD